VLHSGLQPSVQVGWECWLSPLKFIGADEYDMAESLPRLLSSHSERLHKLTTARPESRTTGFPSLDSFEVSETPNLTESTLPTTGITLEHDKLWR